MLDLINRMFVSTHKKELQMKKIILLIAICLLPNLATAAGSKWPIFSNKKGAEYSLYVLKGIINKFPETSQIENYTYKIDPHTCEIPLNPDDFNETQLVEYKIAEPSESDATENTANYALFIDDTKIDDSSLLVTRSEIIDIAIIDDFYVSIEPSSDVLNDTQNVDSLSATKKKKRKIKDSHAKKIQKEKTNSTIINELPITPIPVSRTKSTHIAEPDSEVKNTFESKQQEIIENAIIEDNTGNELVDTTKKKNNCCSIL
jgi:hypothetical protein